MFMLGLYCQREPHQKMPQVFHVLRCFACSLFQVHQVKKKPKWQCKVCGEKQSVRKVYGEGSGKDCRQLVQTLNSTAALQAEKEVPERHYHGNRDRDETFQSPAVFPDQEYHNPYQQGGSVSEMVGLGQASKWSLFCEEEEKEEHLEEHLQEGPWHNADIPSALVTTVRPTHVKRKRDNSRGFGGKRRKQGIADYEDSYTTSQAEQRTYRRSPDQSSSRENRPGISDQPSTVLSQHDRFRSHARTTASVSPVHPYSEAASHNHQDSEWTLDAEQNTLAKDVASWSGELDNDLIPLAELLTKPQNPLGSSVKRTSIDKNVPSAASKWSKYTAFSQESSEDDFRDEQECYEDDNYPQEHCAKDLEGFDFLKGPSHRDPPEEYLQIGQQSLEPTASHSHDASVNRDKCATSLTSPCLTDRRTNVEFGHSEQHGSLNLQKWSTNDEQARGKTEQHSKAEVLIPELGHSENNVTVYSQSWSTDVVVARVKTGGCSQANVLNPELGHSENNAKDFEHSEFAHNGKNGGLYSRSWSTDGVVHGAGVKTWEHCTAKVLNHGNLTETEEELTRQDSDSKHPPVLRPLNRRQGQVYGESYGMGGRDLQGRPSKKCKGHENIFQVQEEVLEDLPDDFCDW